MDRLPFEPVNRSKKKKAAKPESPPVASESHQGTASSESLPRIPEVVNRRIVRRVALFCGIPTFSGFAILLLSYLIVSRHWFEIPNVAVILVSMLFLGLGVLGISYGAISASWDADRLGGWWGWQEFTKNLGYLMAAWKAMRSTQPTK